MVLANLSEEAHKLAVMTVCIMVFLTMLNWGTNSLPFEIIAATAG